MALLGSLLPITAGSFDKVASEVCEWACVVPGVSLAVTLLCWAMANSLFVDSFKEGLYPDSLTVSVTSVVSEAALVDESV